MKKSSDFISGSVLVHSSFLYLKELFLKKFATLMYTQRHTTNKLLVYGVVLLIYCSFLCESTIIYRVHQNYGNQGLMERYKFNFLSATNLTRG